MLNLKTAAVLALAPATALATGFVSATAYSSTTCTSADVLKSFTESLACIATPGALALGIDAATQNCQVFIFSDEMCSPKAFITSVNLSEKCHNTDRFNSVLILCS